jgi:hypothetical protein
MPVSAWSVRVRITTDNRGAWRVAPLCPGRCGEIGAVRIPMTNRSASLSASCRVVIRCGEVQEWCMPKYYVVEFHRIGLTRFATPS